MADASIWKPGSTTALVNAENSSKTQHFTATASQTVFTLTNFEYVVGTGSLEVYVNGVKQILTKDFTETSSTSFTLVTGADLNDDVEAVGLVGSTNTVSAAASAAAAAISAAAAAQSAIDATTNGAAQVALAATQAGNAATSASNAATSETNAATSESNAAISETNAAASAAAALISENNSAVNAAAAQAAADAVMWNDVVFKAFADSPISIADADAGKLISIDTSGGNVVVNLPQISTLTLSKPWSVGIKKSTNDVNTVTINRAGTDVIDGGTSTSLDTVIGKVLIPDTDPAPDYWTTMQFGADAIADGSVTAAKLANDAVETAKIKDLNVTTAKLADDAVTSAKLADTAVTPGSYINANITVDPQGRLTAASSGASGGITLGTAQTSTSGTAITFTGIPSGTKKITVNFNGVSTSGTSNPIIQLGDSGGIETSGYISSASTNGGTLATSTAGIVVSGTTAAAATINGSVEFTLEKASSFSWCAHGTTARSDGNINNCAGTKSLSAELTQINITTANGTDTFDAGEINIAYQT